MSSQELNLLSRSPQTAAVEAVYPAEFHFRIIVEERVADLSALEAVVAGHQVTSSLSASQASSSGRYRSFGLSVMISNFAELAAFDAELKKVPGVRMVL